jgi:hypothetical protein
VAWLVAWPTAARSDDGEREACIAAYVDAQTARNAGAFVRARESISTCAREACPGMIKRDCREWQAELPTLTPSVILRVEDEHGRALTDARATIDGRSIPLDGVAVPLDAGEHVVRFEHEGDKPDERVLRLAPRQHDQRVTAVFPEKPPTTKPVPIASYVAGGVAVVALGVFAYASIRGANDRVSRHCDVGCSGADYDHVHQEYLVSDIALGVGLVSIGVAVATWLLTDARSPSSPAAAALFGGTRAVQ